MAMKKTITPETALTRLADLCARSEQCEYDVRQKLFKMGMTASQTEEIISALKGDKFIDNARFARSYSRDKCRFSSWGRHKIRMGLMAKRVSAADITEGLEAIDDADYLEAVRRVARGKSRSLDLHGENAREERIKLYRHILSRGFEPQIATAAVREEVKRTTPQADE